MLPGLPDPRSPLHFQFRGLIQQAFEEHALQTPARIALVSRHGSCTYGDLEEISNRVAARLKQASIGQGQSVVLLASRGPALIYGMLGVLKARAAFFVADAAYPPARILECIAIAQPALLLVCGDVAIPPGLANSLQKIPSLGLPAKKEDLFQVLPSMDSDAATAPLTEDTIAYFGFTSGSTGRPKCILTTHAPLVHFLDWHISQHKLTSEDRFSLLSGLGHDPVFRDVFTPLSLGASLHIPEQSQLFDPYLLVRWLAEQEISVVHLTPALGHIICTGAEGCPGLDLIRHFFWGGDLLRSRLVRRIHEVAPGARQVNFYGATETPQAMSYFDVDAAPELESYPLGRGISDVQLLIVMEAGQLGAVGEVGEIVIRTPYLSQGYLNSKEETRARFVANPFTGDPQDRCYKTGDLGKYLPDGTVAFAGRSDHQVKIRGFRVELDEVLSRVEEQPGIARAVVLAKDLGHESRVLVAYYGCNSGAEIQPRALQQALRQVLPSYMVPSFFVRLASFPLLANAKIDLRALPNPGVDAGVPQDDSAPAMTDRERKLAAIWCKVLGVQQISIHQSFLDLGGDSLSALSVLVSMRRLGIPEAIARGVVQGKTISQIAREEQAGALEAATPAPLSAPARTTLLVNCLRGILIANVVADHWFPGLLNRLPASFAFLQDLFDPIFNLATPGFAIVFGMSLGYYYYPKYRDNRPRVRHMINFGLLLIAVSLLIDEVLEIAEDAVHGIRLTRYIFWNNLFGSLLYYFIALATAPVWFRIIGRFRHEVAACLGMILGSYVLHQLCLVLFLNYEQNLGLLQLGRLMLVAKYAYFNMSMGALAGVALGIFLFRRRSLEGLAARLLLSGLCGGVAGLAILYLDRASFTPLADGDDVGLWRWPVYTGVVLILAGCLTAIINVYETLPTIGRTLVNLTGVLGQCSLIIFVLHEVVLHAKALLVVAGLSDPIALTIPLAAFLIFIFFVMNRIYRLYYGGITAT